MPMNNKSTSDNIVKELKEALNPKESTIAFLMKFARVYNCNNAIVTKTEGYILN